MPNLTKGIDGKFIRTMQIWTPEIWDEGYVDKRGYFRVYRPDYPGCWKSGYAKRYWVVYWLKTGYVQKSDDDLHHKNENKLDDNFSNLQLIKHGDHTSLHQPLQFKICNYCQKSFQLKPSKISRNPKFCSQECYHKMPRSKEHRQNISAGIEKAYQEGRR